MRMAWGLSKPSGSPIAVDFGVDSLKLLQIVPTDPPQMIAAASVQVPEDARFDPALRHVFLAEQLKKLLKVGGFRGRRAICSIPAYQTLVQHIEIARVEHENLDEQIGLHLRQRLNVDPGRMVIRSHQVGQCVRDGSAKQQVMCFAASREAVLRFIETAHRARLDVVGMHAEHLAMLRAFAHLYRRKDDAQRTTAFIDLGAGTTKFVIAHGSELIFAKTVHAGGDHLVRAYAARRGIGFAEAREARIGQAAEQGDATAMTMAPAAASAAAEQASGWRGGAPAAGLAILDAQFTPAARPSTATTDAADHDGADDVVENIIDELQLSARYHHSLFPDRPIEKLVFLGGESRQVALCQRIARALRIGAQLGDPLARMVRVSQGRPPIGADMRQPQPGWAVPMGLCLSEANL